MTADLGSWGVYVRARGSGLSVAAELDWFLEAETNFQCLAASACVLIGVLGALGERSSPAMRRILGGVMVPYVFVLLSIVS